MPITFDEMIEKLRGIQSDYYIIFHKAVPRLVWTVFNGGKLVRVIEEVDMAYWYDRDACANELLYALKKGVQVRMGTMKEYIHYLRLHNSDNQVVGG